MNTERNWSIASRNDTVLNGTLIGAGIVIVLLSILSGPLEHLEAPAPAPVSAALDAGEAGRG